jgi:hypothetical protein
MPLPMLVKRPEGPRPFRELVDLRRLSVEHRTEPNHVHPAPQPGLEKKLLAAKGLGG